MTKNNKMKQPASKPPLMAAFALAGAMAFSPVSQALAGETVVTLGNGDTAVVQGGGTKVEMDADGNVKVHVNGKGSVVVHTSDGITFRAANDPSAALKPGDTLADGTTFAGSGLSTTPADAPGAYTWGKAKDYCDELVANGHDDWRLPTADELNVLFNNRAAIGGFEEHWYWSSSENPNYLARIQRFSDGRQGFGDLRFNDNVVRCVRP